MITQTQTMNKPSISIKIRLSIIEWIIKVIPLSLRKELATELTAILVRSLTKTNNVEMRKGILNLINML